MGWWEKKKPKEEEYDYTFFTLSSEEFDKIEAELKDVGCYKHLDGIHNIIVLHIPVKGSEGVLDFAKSKEINVAPSGRKVSLSPEDRKKAYTSLYERVLKPDVELIFNKILYDEGTAVRDKTEIDRKINEILAKVDKISSQFNSPGKFREIAEDEDMGMTLEDMCAKMRQFRGSKY